MAYSSWLGVMNLEPEVLGGIGFASQNGFDWGFPLKYMYHLPSILSITSRWTRGGVVLQVSMYHCLFIYHVNGHDVLLRWSSWWKKHGSRLPTCKCKRRSYQVESDPLLHSINKTLKSLMNFFILGIPCGDWDKEKRPWTGRPLSNYLALYEGTTFARHVSHYLLYMRET